MPDLGSAPPVDVVDVKIEVDSEIGDNISLNESVNTVLQQDDDTSSLNTSVVSVIKVED